MCVSVVYMHVCTWICIPMYVYTQRLKKIDSWVSSIILCLISLIQGLSANLVHFFFLSRPASSELPGSSFVCFSKRLGCQHVWEA